MGIVISQQMFGCLTNNDQHKQKSMPIDQWWIGWAMLSIKARKIVANLTTKQYDCGWYQWCLKQCQPLLLVPWTGEIEAVAY